MPTRVLVAIDDDVERRLVCGLVAAEPDLVLTAEVACLDRGAGVARRLRPDVVVLWGGEVSRRCIEVTRALRSQPRAPRVLLLLARARPRELLVEGIHAGATGQILANDRGAIAEAIRAVAGGVCALSDVLVETLSVSPGHAAPQGPGVQLPPGITLRERDVLVAIGVGHPNRDIARMLGLSDATIKTYVSRLLTKLGYTNRTQLALAAHRAGLVGTDGAWSSGGDDGTGGPAVS